MIRKVITDSYENIHFSDKFESEPVHVALKEFDVRSEHFKKIPTVTDVRDFLKTELITSAIFSTSAIGRPELDESDVRAYLIKNQHSLEKVQEKFVGNIKRAYEYIDKNYQTLDLNTDTLRKLHMIFTIDTEEGLPGVFRSRERTEPAKDYTPPKSSLQELTEQFCQWFNSPDMASQHPAVKAFLAHYHIGMLQPFNNANGRVARAVEAFMLKKAGHIHLPAAMSQFYRRNRKDYIKAFIKNEKTGGFDMTPFLLFCLDGATRSYKMITDTAVSGLRIISVRDHIRMLRLKRQITERQHDLLNILFNYDKPFDLVELLTNPIFSGLYKGYTDNTARNDIKRLKELNAIVSEDGRYYQFNRFVLG